MWFTGSSLGETLVNAHPCKPKQFILIQKLLYQLIFEIHQLIPWVECYIPYYFTEKLHYI